MKKLAISLIAGAAALAVAAPAMAQNRTPQADLTRAAVQERTQNMFDRMDANKDGKVDSADRAARQKAMFDRVDADHNGEISYAEFTAMHGDRKRGAHNPGDRAEAGKRGDRDGHRMAMRGERGPGMAMRAGRGGMGRAADANGDGAITLAELQTAALARFDKVDADHDGTVTAAERKAQREQMRQQWQQRRTKQAG